MGLGTTTTYYIGGILEKVTQSGVTEYRHLIPGGSSTAIHTRRDNGTASTYYVTTDHLGSGDLVMDSAATVLARESFTPFGARRGSNWQGNPTTAEYATFASTTRRGFTGHEMLDYVNLVHMNGRVYDPYLGRFLSSDPIVQTLAMSQALNPYSYVMNNPLSLIDPSGYSWLSKAFHSIGRLWGDFWKKWGSTIIDIAFTVVGMPFIGGLIASAFNSIVNGGNFGSFVQGFAIGAVAGAIAGAIGGRLAGALGAGGSSLAAKIFQGALVGGIAGGISSSVMGSSFWSGFAGGAITGGITAGVVGEYQAWKAKAMGAGSIDLHKEGLDANAAREVYDQQLARLRAEGIIPGRTLFQRIFGLDDFRFVAK